MSDIRDKDYNWVKNEREQAYTQWQKNPKKPLYYQESKYLWICDDDKSSNNYNILYKGKFKNTNCFFSLKNDVNGKFQSDDEWIESMKQAAMKVNTNDYVYLAGFDCELYIYVYLLQTIYEELILLFDDDAQLNEAILELYIILFTDELEIIDVDMLNSDDTNGNYNIEDTCESILQLNDKCNLCDQLQLTTKRGIKDYLEIREIGCDIMKDKWQNNMLISDDNEYNVDIFGTVAMDTIDYSGISTKYYINIDIEYDYLNQYEMDFMDDLIDDDDVDIFVIEIIYVSIFFVLLLIVMYCITRNRKAHRYRNRHCRLRLRRRQKKLFKLYKQTQQLAQTHIYTTWGKLRQSIIIWEV